MEIKMSSYCFFIAASWGDAAIPKHFKALAQRLVERGHRVVYLPHGLQISLDEGNFHVRSFPSPRPTKLRDFIFLHKLVREYQPDCMIANFGAVNVMNIVGWLNRVPCRVNWYRTLSTAIDLDTVDLNWKNKLFVWRKQLVYQLATVVAANSEAARLDTVNIYRIKPKKTRVFYNSLPDLGPQSWGNERTTNVIVCPGRLFPTKGQDVVIRALACLKPQGITPEVRFVGAGEQLSRYQSFAEELGVREQCIFVGRVPHKEMLREMAAAEFTIVPSRSEAFGMVNIESMSVGTPVIASAVGGIPEIIRDGVDGYLVPPDDPEALAEKMKLLLSDPTLREQMGENARQRFLDMFEQTKNIEQQVLWFEELVERHRTPSL